jgi:hypothetical protein
LRAEERRVLTAAHSGFVDCLQFIGGHSGGEMENFLSELRGLASIADAVRRCCVLRFGGMDISNFFIHCSKNVGTAGDVALIHFSLRNRFSGSSS